MNTSPTLSLIGKWTYSNNQGGIVHFHSLIDLKDGHGTGLVLGGWTFNGWDNNTLYPVDIILLKPDANGTVSIQTSQYISDPRTNGQGSIIVADFNRDGFSDIFLAAHNESPTVPTASTAYISQSNGKLAKITLDDSIAAHSASLGNLNGIPTIVTSGYGPTDPYYQYNTQTNKFDIHYWGGTHAGSLYGSSVTVGDFDNDGQSELIIGDCKTGPGYDFVPNSPTKLVIYKLNEGNLDSRPSVEVPLYFDQSRYQNQGLVSQFSGLSHNYRVWADDFNHDGRPDLLLGVGVWSASQGWQKSKLQMLQNMGNLNFSDLTDQLGSAYDENSSYVDYSMMAIDIDQSNIKTYFLAGDPNAPVSSNKNANYILLNDGTGKLYTALHNEFSQWSDRINKYIPYVESDGTISFIGVTRRLEFYQVDVSYNPTYDFQQDVKIDDRNNSKLIRTWAGDDVINDLNSNGGTRIDGGLGFDTANYSKSSDLFSISLYDRDFLVKGSAIDDSLVSIEKIQFADTSLDTSLFLKTAQLSKQSVTNLVELYIASFNRAPDAMGLNYWGSRLYDGMPLEQIAKSFFVQPETIAAYPTGQATATFVTTVYNNVLSRGPDQSGLDYWVKQIDNGVFSKDVFLLAIINGAKATTGSPTDRQTLANKTTVGMDFAFSEGLSNTTWGKDVMSGVTSVMSTVDAAMSKTDAYGIAASSGATAELTIKMVGIWDGTG